MKTWSKRVVELVDYCIKSDLGECNESTIEFWTDGGLKFDGAQVWRCKCQRTRLEYFDIGDGMPCTRTNVEVLVLAFVPGVKGYVGSVVLNGVHVNLGGKRLQTIQDKVAKHQFMSKLSENLA